MHCTMDLRLCTRSSCSTHEVVLDVDSLSWTMVLISAPGPALHGHTCVESPVEPAPGDTRRSSS